MGMSWFTRSAGKDKNRVMFAHDLRPVERRLSDPAGPRMAMKPEERLCSVCESR